MAAENRRTERSRLEKRLARLSSHRYEDLVSRVNAVLERQWMSRQPDPVLVRTGFARRATPLSGDVSDNAVPARVHRPPLTRLVSPRGVALRLFLIALFEAQCRHRVGARMQNERPLERRSSTVPGWVDFLAVAAGSSSHGARASSPRQNLARQIKHALDVLVQAELVELPRGHNRHGRHEGFSLQDEQGTQGLPTTSAYTVPGPSDNTFGLPVDFFLNGWVHVLEDSEIAAYLAIREVTQRTSANETGGVFLTPDQRLRRYGLSKDAYDTLTLLADAGLVHTERDPRRRPNGTVIDFMPGEVVPPNRHTLTDHGLAVPAIDSVRAALEERLERL